MPKNAEYGVPDSDTPEWSAQDFRNAKRFADLPASLKEKLASRKRRGPQRSPTKQLVSLRISPDVLAALRATGPGWQARADEGLRKMFVVAAAEDPA
jgi:uncharacterized protein (DUF4415 family)